MNDTPPAESKPPGPIPADDPGRVLTHVSPDTDDSLPHLGVVGDTYTILVSGADTAGRYTLIDMHVPPGGGPPPHRHDFEEMFTILDGEIELTFRGVSAVATAGETINVPANAPHVFRNVSDRPARLLCLCSPAGQEEFFKEVGVPVAHRTEAPPALDDAATARVHRQGDRTRPEVPDRAAARRPEALIRETEETTVSQQQRDALDQLLRDAPLDLGGEVAEQRVIFEEMMAAIPVPADVTTSSGSLGGIPVVNVEVAGADHASVIFYLHGGAYAIGTAASSVGLASDLARRAGARLVDGRLQAGT